MKLTYCFGSVIIDDTKGEGFTVVKDDGMKRWFDGYFDTIDGLIFDITVNYNAASVCRNLSCEITVNEYRPARIFPLEADELNKVKSVFNAKGIEHNL